MADRMKDTVVVRKDSWPGKQNACISGWVVPEASSAALRSAGIAWVWKGPAAHATCCTDVNVGWEKTKIVLLEL